MKIASAQINCTIGQIEQNLNKHYQIIKTAIEEKVDLIAFPEMSITGYCRKEGKQLAFTENDNRLDKLKQLASNGSITIIAGAPIRIKENLFIGAFVIYPNKSVDIYTKHHLHDGEDLYYHSTEGYNPTITLKKERISLAICADINNENHPYLAKKNRSTVYLPCIFYSKNGIDIGHEQLKKYAKKYSLNILMSNYSGELWNMESGGKSAFWDSNGKLIDQMDSDNSGILIVEKKNGEWKTKTLVTKK